MEGALQNGDLKSTTERGPASSNETAQTSASRYAAQAMQLLADGKLLAALQCLNRCLGDEDDSEVADPEIQIQDLIREKPGSTTGPTFSDLQKCSADEGSILEKRCLVNMRLKRYNRVVHDAKKMLELSPENSVAYRCLLAALCKMKKLEQGNEVIRLFQKNSPRNLEMMECRTKLESLMVAVKNGIEAADAFSDVEELLGLNYDWLLLRKTKDPQWKYRPLPSTSSCSFVLCLQYRFGHCSLGEKCPDAHGEGELLEWKKRFEIENISRKISNLKVDDGCTYIKDLLAKMEGTSDSSKILFEGDIEDLRVSCVSPLHATVQQKKFKKFTWKFSVKSVKPLSNVCLLHEHHRQYFHISSCSFVGANDSVILNQAGRTETSSQVITPRLSEAALAIAGTNVNSYAYKVKVVFTPEVYGNFQQTVVFDTGDEPKLVRNVAVDVVPATDTEDKSSRSEPGTSPVDSSKPYRTNIPWNFGNAEMIDGHTGERVTSEKLGFALISGGPVSKPESFMENTKDPLSRGHYKERMRFLLTQEERSRQEILAKYNVTTSVVMSEKYLVSGGYNEGMTRYAIDGALYGRINLFRDISEDTAVGRLILRSCNSVLLTKSEESRKIDSKSKKLKVYLCPISDKTKNSVYLDLGKACVSGLEFVDQEVVQLDIQFQLDRTAFLEQKRVIDKLEEKHLAMLFPDLAVPCNIPWSPIKQWSDIENADYRLNPKQKEALIAITAENCPVPPILVIGPFGTGKTFTLAQCIKRILTQKNSRVMVCTHSNSAADLYIKEYLDSWVKEGFTDAKPLRIYYEMRNFSSVHPTVLQYCTVEAMKFRPPTYEEVLDHRVIVVTLSTSYLLMELNLPEDTFSHILLDEAAQAMESEAITPLMSAGKSTKLVLAGDHMQLSPELFSEEARNIHPSLLERLHALYPDTHPCKLMLCENYRSHSAIIQFVSDSFYTKKLECAKSQPVHDNFFPLTFFAARGEDVQDSESTSYYNMAEVFELTEKITELVSSWPEKWGDYRDENAIGVLTPYADQVTRIRSRLRKKGLHSVSVERVFNVQGKQFRAVFLTTVRSFRPWVRILPETVGNEVDLGFFSSPKLLNTALTRAQSLVAVVGDPVSLCSVGKCRRIWEDYIRICHENKSLCGITFLQLKQSILGVEMRLTWGLNPLANEFQPLTRQAVRTTTTQAPIAAVVSIAHTQPSVQSFPFPQQYNNHRPRPPYIYPDPHAPVYGLPQQPTDFNSPIPSHPASLTHPPFFQGPQNQIFIRPPYVGGINVIPQFQTYPQPPMAPWSQNIGAPLQFPASTQNPPWSTAPTPIDINSRAPLQYVSKPAQYPGSHPLPPNTNVSEYISQQQNAQFVNHGPPAAASSEGFNANQNPNFPAKSSQISIAQQQYATGMGLYKRPAVAAPTHSPNVVALPEGFSGGVPHAAYTQSNSSIHPRLTQEELNLINRALEHHAASGEPFHGDLQTLRSKLIQAANSGSGSSGSLNRHPQPSTLAVGALARTSANVPQKYPAQGTSITAGGTLAPPSSMFVPVPQKSPGMLSDQYRYSTGHQQDHQSLSTNAAYSRIWANGSSSLSTMNDGMGSSSSGFHSHSGIMDGNISGLPPPRNHIQPYLDQGASGIRHPHHHTQSVNMMAPSVSNITQGSSMRNLPGVGYNNNTIQSQYEYGYHADVGGLKAQLSGGIRQGFGERSAFSRVNGNQDMDIVSDNSGLGRSYANVVKAAVTAAVGSGVPTSTHAQSMSSRQLPPRFYKGQEGPPHFGP